MIDYKAKLKRSEFLSMVLPPTLNNSINYSFERVTTVNARNQNGHADYKTAEHFLSIDVARLTDKNPVKLKQISLNENGYIEP